MVKYRDYQIDIIEKGSQILRDNRLLYLAMQVRTGKTLTSLGICEKMSVENVLFITKKKAISSINKDFSALCPSNFVLFVINYESVHTIPRMIKWDIVICDEAHSMGAFPKPSKRAKQVKDLIKANDPYVILLSGTPTPESYSQMYHQVYGIPNNPFNEFVNFYRFTDKHVDVKERKINGMIIKDYSNGMQSIMDSMKPYTINYTQVEAGFKSEIDEEIIYVPMSDLTYKLSKRLKRDLVIEGNDEVILADTPVKLMTKLHQLYSGTIKFESGNSKVLDYSKALFIAKRFDGYKIAIFYKFKEELNALNFAFQHNLTTDLKEFENSDKCIALQIVSGREGISLKDADYLVYYNIDFSATSYWQSRDRMTTKDRLFNKVYWIFCEGGIEDSIYKAVSKKKNYTLSHFKKNLISL